MHRLKEYLLQPETVWKVIVGVFSLGIVRATLNNKIDNISQAHIMYQARLVALEAKSNEYALDIVEVKTKLANIESLLMEMRKK